jgi:hypothetical protein
MSAQKAMPVIRMTGAPGGGGAVDGVDIRGGLARPRKCSPISAIRT